MIIETDNFDFNAEYVSGVDREYDPGIDDVIFVHLHGAGARLAGENARSFLRQWAEYKALHNERYYFEARRQ